MTEVGVTDVLGRDDGLLTSRPPERFRPVREWVLYDTLGLAGVRRELLAAITGGGAAPASTLAGVPERMILVASELATNALTHGLPPTLVGLSTDGRDFLLDVGDHDLSTEPRVAGGRPLGEGGFGLHIARRLSQEVGWYATATTKHVWAVFAVGAGAATPA
ncbi:ATP-binding protein [Cellulomonas sp. Marseille-Q8402]